MNKTNKNKTDKNKTRQGNRNREMIKKPPGRPRSIQSHQAMLKATLELLAEVGFEAMSIDAIATRARVGKTTIYRRYAGKEELVADAIESIREEVVIPNTGSLWGRHRCLNRKCRPNFPHTPGTTNHGHDYQQRLKQPQSLLKFTGRNTCCLDDKPLQPYWNGQKNETNVRPIWIQG